jgi:hypothetical protein
MSVHETISNQQYKKHFILKLGRVDLALAIALVSRVEGAAMVSAPESIRDVCEHLFRLPCGGELLDESLSVSRVQSRFYFSSFKSYVV